ncbi:MAG: AraC family transcriptional regulator [Oscillospiraceae bacterium]
MEHKSSIFTSNVKISVHNAVVQILPSNYDFPTHMHNTVEIIICTKGVCLISLQNEVVEINMGEYIVVFPGTLHDTRTGSYEGCTILQTHFYIDIFKTVFNFDGTEASLSFLLEVSTGKRKYFKGCTNIQLYSCIDNIRIELNDHLNSWKNMINLYLLEAVTLISRDLQYNDKNDNIYKNKYLMKSLDFIHDHYGEQIRAEDIALNAHISVRYLSQLFKDELAIGIAQYINCVRIQKAIELMIKRPNYPLTNVALDVGFQSLQYFSRVFKEQTEVTPSNYFDMYSFE